MNNEIILCNTSTIEWSEIKNDLAFQRVRGDAFMAILSTQLGLSIDEAESAFVGMMYENEHYIEPMEVEVTMESK